jgi:hypothetical protein
MTRLLCIFTVLILTSCEEIVDSVAELGTSTCATQDFEVTPPVQGGSAEIKHPDQITENGGIISAATPQDAANAAVGKLTKADGSGVAQIEVGSGMGYVAMGQGAFDSKMANPVAMRIAKRNATLRAYMDAQRKLGEFLEGTEVDAEQLIDEYSNNIDTSETSLLNFQNTQSGKLKIAVNAYISGYVLYDVVYQANGVFVSIIVTPKTLRGLTSHTASKITLKQAKNAEAGMRFVKDDISKMLENNVIFPVGGKQVYIRPTQEFAFLGFGAEPIRVNANWPATQNQRQKDLAVTRANDSAKQNLLTMLQGNSIQYTFSDSNITAEEFKQFDEQKGDITVFDNAKQKFFSEQNTNEEFLIAVSGRLPPGIQLESYCHDDNNDGIDDWAFSIAVYIPAVSAQAKQLRTDIKTASKPSTKE